MTYTLIGQGTTDSNGIAHMTEDAQGNPVNGFSSDTIGEYEIVAKVGNVESPSVTIEVTAPLKSLTLISDKSILSYADSGSATLTATYMEAGVGVSGQSVVFKKGSTVLDTVTTDSNGVATCTYNSAGSGDVVLSAECNSVQDTYSIEDCINYDSCTVDATKWTIQSGRSASFSNNGMSISSSSWGGVIFKPQISVPSELTFEIVEVSGSASTYLHLMNNDSNSDSDHNSYLKSEFKTNNSLTIDGTAYNIGNRGAGKYKFSVGANSISVYREGSLLGTFSKTVQNYWFTLGLRYGIIIKDIKVKPLV